MHADDDPRDHYAIVLRRPQILFGDTDWYATCPAFGIVADGITPDEAVSALRSYLDDTITHLKAAGEALPPADAELDDPIDIFQRGVLNVYDLNTDHPNTHDPNTHDPDLDGDQPAVIDYTDANQLELHDFGEPFRIDPDDWEVFRASLPRLVGEDVSGRLLHAATGLTHHDLNAILIDGRPVPADASARSALHFVATLLRTTRERTAPLLGVSAARIRRNPTLTVDMIDRLQAVLETYVEVARLKGYDAAS